MKFILALALIVRAVHGQQSMFAGEDGVISQIADGDGWKTSISLNNIDATPSQYKLSFFSDSGTPLSLQTNFGTGTFVYGTIPPRGSVTIETAGTSVSLSQGWGLMETIFLVPGTSSTIAPGATIAGTVLYFRPPTVPRPTEASEPVDFSLEGQWVLPFDHLNGYSSGVALLNHVMYQDISVFITILDQNGNQIVLDSITLLRGQHLAFTLTQKYPQTIGLRGTVRIQTSAISVNVLGLHISPSGVISSTSPTSWF